MKRLAVLGSTGSIGRQTLDVVRKNSQLFKIVSLTAKENAELLEKQIDEFKPKVVALLNENKAKELRKKLEDSDLEVLEGQDGIIACATHYECDIVVNGLVGISGLVPTLEAIDKGKDIALANKETLVTAGSIVMKKARDKKVNILPVDSEHSAIFQCIGQSPRSSIKNIILTASGGPFRGMTKKELEEVGVEDALKHPNWKMGNKITVDSATLMNKGLEVIEARWLFDVKPDEIQVVIHPQSIVHSMVEFIDGSVLAQMGHPDMRLPIQYALTYPDRFDSSFSAFNPVEASRLDFYAPDIKTFRSLELAYNALRDGDTMTVVLNGANEVAVDMFLKRQLPFIDIPCVVERVMNRHKSINNPSLDDIIYWDRWSRKEAISIIKRMV